MAFEPINIFSHRIDPAGVAQLVKSLVPDAIIAGPVDDWSEIEAVTTKGSLFRREKKLILGHDAEYYDGPDWPRQIMGMQGYFSNFPATDNQQDIFRLIRSFRFSMAVPVDDLNIDSNDPRLKILHAICRHLDGVFFTPSSLRDSAGRILIDADGVVDPNAVLPNLPSVEDHPDVDNGQIEDDEDPEPPGADRIAQRTLAMTAVAARATMELDFLQDNLTAEDGETHRNRLMDWVAALEIDDEFEAQEWKVLQRSVGSLEQQDFINAMWRVEGLVVLAWALQLHDMPVYDELVIPMELYQSIGIMDVDAGNKVRQQAELRSNEELKQMQEHLLALHWRIRDFSIRPEAMDFVRFSKDCWFGSFDISNFRTINNDLAIGEEAIVDADPDDVSTVTSIAMERHQAINWLRGYDSRVYSEVTTST